MKKEIFGFLTAKYRKQRVIDSLLLFFAGLLQFTVIAVFLFNLVSANRFLYFALSAIIFIVLFYREAGFLSDEYKSVQKINSLNPQMRNLILAAYEKKTLSEGKALIGDLASKNISEIRCFSVFERNRRARFLSVSLIVFLLTLSLFPRHFSNAFGLSEKSTVIDASDGDLFVSGYNLGSISGKLLIEDGGSIKRFDKSAKYEPHSMIFYAGPGVKSNTLRYSLLKEFSCDSIVTFVKPHPYQKTPSWNERIFLQYVPEYAEVKTIKYNLGRENVIFETNKFEKSSVIVIGKKDTLKLNMVKDESPFVKILANENEIKNREILMIPVACADDYKVTGIGIMIKTDMDSIIFNARPPKDSISVFEMNLSEIRGDEGWIKCFADDNNPFRKQRGWSQELRFSKKLDIIELLSGMDSDEVLSGFDEKAEDMMNELAMRKKEIEQNKIKNALESYSENLKDIKNILEELDASLKEESRKMLPDEIMKQMYEIKKELEKIDMEVLSKLIKESENLQKSKISETEAMNLLKQNSKQIEESLKQLRKMLETLNKLTELKSFQERVKNIEKMMEESGKNQKSVTEEIKKEAEMAENSDNLREWTKDLKDAEELSKAAEKKSSKRENVKKKLDEIAKEVQEKMNSIEGKDSYDKNFVIMTLLASNEMITNKESTLLAYSSILEYAKAENDPKNPLFLMVQRGRMIAEDKNSLLKDVINHNYAIIASLLKKAPPSGGGMSLDEMMESLSSLSEEQKSLSQAMWSMFNDQSGESETVSEIARYQRKIAEKMKELGEKKSGGEGDGLKMLADSLLETAEMIEKQGLTEDALNKQERTLNRMLKLTKSLYRQGIDDKRESEEGKYYNNPVKIKVPEDYGYKKADFQKMLEEFLKEREDKEYEYFIRRYYMELLK